MHVFVLYRTSHVPTLFCDFVIYIDCDTFQGPCPRALNNTQKTHAQHTSASCMADAVVNGRVAAGLLQRHVSWSHVVCTLQSVLNASC